VHAQADALREQIVGEHSGGRGASRQQLAAATAAASIRMREGFASMVLCAKSNTLIWYWIRGLMERAGQDHQRNAAFRAVAISEPQTSISSVNLISIAFATTRILPPWPHWQSPLRRTNRSEASVAVTSKRKGISSDHHPWWRLQRIGLGNHRQFGRMGAPWPSTALATPKPQAQTKSG